MILRRSSASMPVMRRFMIASMIAAVTVLAIASLATATNNAAPNVEKAANLGAGAGDSGSGGSGSGGRRRSIKDWSKLSAADYDELESEWLADEYFDPDDDVNDPMRVARGRRGTGAPPERKGPKTEMAFVDVTTKTKEETDALATKWQKVAPLRRTHRIGRPQTSRMRELS
jgi:hypothetical protein